MKNNFPHMLGAGVRLGIDPTHFLLVVKLFALALVLGNPVVGFSQSTPLEKVSQDTKSLSATEHQDSPSIEEMLKRRGIEGRINIKSITVCACLNARLPAGWRFSDYVSITTKSREENGYQNMPPVYQKAYDTVILTKEICVNKSNKKG